MHKDAFGKLWYFGSRMYSTLVLKNGPKTLFGDFSKTQLSDKKKN